MSKNLTLIAQSIDTTTQDRLPSYEIRVQK